MASDDLGRFSAPVHVPASALPGEHWVVGLTRCNRQYGLARFLVRTDWPQFRFDLQRSGFNPFENVLSPSNVSGLKLAWAVPTVGPEGVRSSPAVANGVVYVGLGDSKLYAFNATTGTQLWSAATGSGIHSSYASSGASRI